MPSLEPWQHLEGRASSLPSPHLFFCSCEMLISVSFSWFMCFGGWSGRFREGGTQLRTSRPQIRMIEGASPLSSWVTDGLTW